MRRDTKKWCSALLSVMLALSLWPAPVTLAGNSQQLVQKPEANSSADELIIKYKAGSNLTKIVGKYKGKIEKVGKQIGKLQTGSVILPKGADKKAIIKLLQADPDVEYVQPNYLYRAASGGNNDPPFNQPWNLSRIKADQAWDNIVPGNSPVTVAVVDTGVKSSDEYLKAILLPGINTIDGSRNTEDDSSNLHGTRVAGLLSAVTSNRKHNTAVSKVLPVKALGGNGLGYDIDIANGIVQAADQGAKVINLSLSTSSYSKIMDDAIQYAISGKGAVVVAATDNTSSALPNSTAYPAALPSVIAVGATDMNNTRAAFSQAADYIDLVAPGVSIRAADGSVTNGTSFAAAQVSGAAALVLSKRPGLTQSQVKKVLENTAVDLGSANRDPEYGNGLLDVYAAVNASVSSRTELILLGDGPDPIRPGRSTNVISFYQSNFDNLTLKIYDKSKKLVKTLVKPQNVSSGNTVVSNRFAFKWDGTNSLNVPVPKGTYSYVLQGVDRKGIASEPLTGTITVDDSVPMVRHVGIAPNPLPANGSSTTLSYELTKDSQVTIGIYRGITLVRTLTHRLNQKAGSNQVSWDGRNDRGEIVPVGVYMYRIHAGDAAGNVAPVVSGLISVTVPPVQRFGPSISNVEVSKNPYIIGDGSLLFRYTLSEDMDETVTIYNSAGQTVTTLRGNKLSPLARQASWDGEDNAFKTVPPGEYTYKVTARDRVGVEAPPVSGKFMVTNSTLLDVTAAPAALATAINYRLTGPANITVRIFDSSRRLVRTLSNNVYSLTGAKTLEWDSTDDGGAPVGPGTYIYQVTAIQANGRTEKASGTIPIVNAAPVISGTVVAPAYVDTVQGIPAKVTYQVSEPVQTTVVVKKEGQSATSKEVYRQDVPAGAVTVEWNGTDSSGQPVPSGDYRFYIIATDAGGLKAETTVPVFVNEREGNLVTNVRDGPDPLQVTGINKNTINFTVPEDRNLTVELFDSLNHVVRTLVSGVSYSAGTIAAIDWDGKNNAGVFVEDGTYTYKIRGTDASGIPMGTVVGGSITTDKNQPVISNSTATPSSFMPPRDASVSISYDLNEVSEVTIGIYNASGVLVRSISNNVVNTAGSYSVVWDGKNNAGVIVPAGTYSYRIQARDGVGHIGNFSGNIQVVEEPIPVVTGVSDTPDPFKVTGATEATISYSLSDLAKVTVGLYNSSNQLVRTLIDNVETTAGAHTVQWDGRTDGGTLVEDGTYTYKINTVNLSGKPGVQVTGTVTTDKNSPVISSLTAIPNPFVPTRDTDISIGYTLNEDAQVTIGIYNAANSLVRTLASNVVNTTGNNSVTWDGKNGSGVFVPPGDYSYQIEATDLLGFTGSTSGVVRVDDAPTPVISAVSDTPDPLKVTGTSESTISYTLSDAANVMIAIYNSSNQLVRTLMNNVATTAGAHTVTWNGKDNSDVLVDDGVYTYKINAVNTAGKVAAEMTGSITTDKTAPAISNDLVTPHPFAPTGYNSTSIKYDLSEDSSVTVSIYNSLGVLVKTISNNVANTAGNHSVTWDGKNSAGTVVPAGTYSYRVSATDNIGFTSVVSGVLQVDDAPAPVISGVSDTPDPLKVTGATLSTISYSLSDTAKVSVEIFDSGNQLVRTLLHEVATLGGAHTISWDGQDNGGALVEDGIYTYKINAFNEAGKTAVEVTGTITTDKTAPKVNNLVTTPDPYVPLGSNTVSIGYDLNENASVTVNIYNTANTLIKTIASNLSQVAGHHSLTWDGKNGVGVIVPGGTYSYRIDATDAFGFTSSTTGDIEVQEEPVPEITDVSDTPDPLQVTGLTESTISYTLSYQSNVTVAIYNSSNVLVRKLIDNVYTLPGTETVKWNGKSDGGLLVEDGTYTYKINATTVTGKTAAEKTGLITTDKNAPVISALSATPDPFVPIGSNNATIQYHLSEASRVTVNIYDAANSLVKTLVSNVANTAGNNSLTWDGKDSTNALVLAGTYRYQIEATDSIGFTSSTSGNINVQEEPIPVISAVSDTPDPLKVTGSTQSTISYTLSYPANVTVGIYNSSNQLVRTLINNVSTAAGATTAEWDGKDNGGALVDDGTYTYKIEAVTVTGKTATPATGTILTDKNAPTISNLSATPDPFVPIGSNTVSIGYDLSENANVTVSIYDSSNALVKTIASGVANLSGANTVTWDGKNTAGALVPDGSYAYRIEATDSLGFTATTSGYIDVDEEPTPVISAVNDTPDPLQVTGLTESTISYTLSYPANVKIELYNSSNTLVRTLINNAATTAGAHTALWNGKTDGGTLVDDGIYTYKINAVTVTGKTAAEATGMITTDKNAPVINNLLATPDPFIRTGSNSTSIQYDLSEGSEVSVSIYDASNTLIKTIASGVTNSIGTNSVTWDGTNLAGSLVSAGTYSYRIQATDGVGFTSNAVGTINVQEEPTPVISAVTDTPDPLKVTGSTVATISYNLSYQAKVTVEIVDSGNQSVRTLINNVMTTAGAQTVLWDGKDAGGALVEDGVYTYKINAVTLTGKNAVEVTGTITTDKNSPIINNLSATPDPFVRTGSNSVTLNYNLSENAEVTVGIYDASNSLIRTLVTGAVNVTGNNSVTWDGKNGSGTIVAAGTYSYRIEATDSIGFTGNSSGTFEVQEEPIPVITGANAAPNPMKVTGSTVSTIAYTLSYPAKVKIEIYDSSNQLVRTLLNDVATAAGAQTADWNGKTDGGALVEDGTYTYKINAVTATGKTAAQVTGTITTDKTTPAITGLSATPDPFIRTGNNTVSMSYQLSEDSLVTVGIYDASNALVATVANNEAISAGSNSVTWNGKNTAGVLVAAGVYSYRIEATDAIGFTGTASGTINVQEEPVPVISAVTDTPDPLQVTGSTLSTISYTLSYPANVSLILYDSGDQPVRTLINNVATSAGAQSIAWYGTDDGGAMVADGTYTYKINAVTVTGKAAAEVTGTITTDKTAPVVSNLSATPDPFIRTGSNNASIQYDLSENVDVTVNIYDASNLLIRTIASNVANTSGTNTVTWNGRDGAGVLVPAGIYSYKIEATDRVGFTGNASGSFEVQEEPIPVISAVGDSADPMQVTGSTTSTISYTLSYPAKVTLELYDSGSQLVRTLVNDAATPAGANTAVWNGRTDGGLLVEDGVYTYKINAVTATGKQAVEVSGTITTDKNAPVINGLSATPDPFMRTGSNSASIQFSLSENADVTVEIYDASNALITTLTDSEAKTAGSNTVIWNGKNTAGVLVAAGTYSYRIEATDRVGFISNTSGTLQVQEEPTPVISAVSDTPDPLQVTGSSVSTISYTLSYPAHVTVKIYDSGDQLVRTLIDNVAITAGAKTTGWNGTDDGGALVADGTYTYKINAVTATGKTAVEVTDTITTDKTAPVVSNLSATPDPFIRTGSNNASIQYDLSENADVTVSIYDASNTLVTTIASNVANTSGTNNVTWNGKNGAGVLVNAGIYTYRITATDKVGFASNASGTFEVQEEPIPDISSVSDTPDPLQVTGSTHSTISYALSYPSNVELKIYNNSNQLIRTLVDNAATAAGAHTVLWNGRTDGGTLVEDGIYTYKINAVTATGKVAIEESGTIATDKNAPVISNVTDTPDPFVATGSNSMSIQYDLSEDSGVTVEIYNSSNALIKTLLSNVANLTGNNNVTWNGKNEAGVLVAAGTYSYRITATDGVGFTSNASGVVEVQEEPIPAISGVSDTPDPLKVTGSTTATISYSLSHPGKVTLAIYDSGDQLVRTLINNADTTTGAKTVDWDGKDEGGALVADGTYTYKINAVNTTGRSAVEVTGTITTDKTAPVISNLSAAPDPFMPLGNNDATISYDLSENSDVTVGIYNASNMLVKTIISNVANLPGSNSVTWNGQNNAGVFVPAGTYEYRIHATDRVGLTANVTGTIQVQEEPIPVISGVNDTPDPLQVTGSTESTISYSLSYPARVTIGLYDSGNQLVRTLVNNVATAAGAQTVQWNGLTDGGALVADDTYTYKIEAVTVTGKTAAPATGTIKTDKNAPVISGLTATPDPFLPSRVANINIQYSLNENSTVTVGIYDSSNVLVKTLANNVMRTFGSHSVTWDGKDTSGAVVAEGTYSYRIQATDMVGFSSNVSGSFQLKDEPIPVISAVSDTPDPFQVTGSTVSTISYSLSDPARVTIEILDSGNQLVRTLISNATYAAGAQTAQWNGRNDGGTLVADGTYTYKISVVNVVGKPGTPMTGTITTDKTAPTISAHSSTPNPFEPTGSNQMTISYTLSENAAVTIGIYNSSNVLVKTISSAVMNSAGANSVTWTGQNDAGTYVPAGTYSYRITAVDKVGFSTTVSASFSELAKVPPPVISNGSYVPTGPFKVTGSNSVTIYYTLNEQAYLSLKVYDSQNNLVRTIINNVLTSSGNKAIGWDGRDSIGNLVEDGTYTYRFSAYNPKGAVATDLVRTIQTDKNAPEITNLNVTPNPYNPNPALGILLNISYTLNEESKVTVGIYNSSNALVKTIASTVTQYAGNNSVAWDGKDSSGNVVPDGNYSYRILASDLAGLSRNVSGVFRVEQEKPVISGQRADPDKLKVTGTTATTIYYTLSKAANVTVKIYDSTNRLVSVLLDNSPQTAGTKPVAWYGKEDDGSLVADGVYTYRINAVDEYGQAAIEATGTITTDKTAPTISNITATPNPFNYTRDGTMTIKYHLDEAARTTLTIHDSSGVQVRAVTNAVLNTIGENTITFDVLSDSSTRLPVGSYNYRFLVTDEIGLSRSASGVFRIE